MTGTAVATVEITPAATGFALNSELLVPLKGCCSRFGRNFSVDVIPNRAAGPEGSVTVFRSSWAAALALFWPAVASLSCWLMEFVSMSRSSGLGNGLLAASSPADNMTLAGDSLGRPLSSRVLRFLTNEDDNKAARSVASVVLVSVNFLGSDRLVVVLVVELTTGSSFKFGLARKLGLLRKLNRFVEPLAVVVVTPNVVVDVAASCAAVPEPVVPVGLGVVTVEVLAVVVVVVLAVEVGWIAELFLWLCDFN